MKKRAFQRNGDSVPITSCPTYPSFKEVHRDRKATYKEKNISVFKDFKIDSKESLVVKLA